MQPQQLRDAGVTKPSAEPRCGPKPKSSHYNGRTSKQARCGRSAQRPPWCVRPDDTLGLGPQGRQAIGLAARAATYDMAKGQDESSIFAFFERERETWVDPFVYHPAYQVSFFISPRSVVG